MLNGDYMVSSAISDAGPIIHLFEITMINCFSIFNTVYIPREVYNEGKQAIYYEVMRLKQENLKYLI